MTMPLPSSPPSPSASRFHVMATPVNGLAAFVAQDLSPQQMARLRAQLTPEEQRWFDGKLLAADKVPLDAVNRFTVMAADIKGESPFAFGVRAGRFGAELGLKGVYKFIMTLLSTESVLRTAPFMWKKVYDGGRMTVESRDGSATIRVTDFHAAPAGCGRITGWFETIGLKTAKDLVCRHSACVHDGAPECVWEFQWSK